MDNLLEWLRAQNSGIETFLKFHRMALAALSTDPAHAAVIRILADFAGRFVEKYYGEPMTNDISQPALDHLIRSLEGAMKASASGPEKYIETLNEIAIYENKSTAI